MTYPQLSFRALRAALFAAVCVGMAMLGHAVAGGALPGPLVLGGAVAGCALLFAPFAGRQRSAAAIIGGLLGAQALLHLTFHFAAPGSPAAITLTSSLPPDALARSLGHMCGGGLLSGDGFVMAVAHVWAALVTGWWLASGEEALWAVLRWLRATLLSPLLGRGSYRAARPPRCYGHSPVLLPRSRVLRHVVAGRAPPALAA
ncbi:hypothetical protein HNR23_002647 [Nocardiopsis mwathae]|uniref:Integral membrane protein n=1 Tax=Nocardiopsis mwathae TaxID=1472723 RepID=A0A7W9YI59_9ACTN|nr:hypothetical protein [Nocardiopsis mwathae]MBB6172587.1 hypothetical protein [Nocardiopsis mwathae]